jgi:hypothetical protein
LFDGPKLVQTRLSDQAEALDAASLARVEEWAETYRARLMDISWFMRVLNETIANNRGQTTVYDMLSLF